MSTKKYPRYRTSRDLEIKFAPQVSVLACGYNHLVRTFGQPTFSAGNNDTFEGTEQCAWHIQFESGETVRIAEERGFGDREHDFTRSKSWRVNSHSPVAYAWIKDAIRDANPNG